MLLIVFKLLYAVTAMRVQIMHVSLTEGLEQLMTASHTFIYSLLRLIFIPPSLSSLLLPHVHYHK